MLRPTCLVGDALGDSSIDRSAFSFTFGVAGSTCGEVVC